jgi:hypothetical protein
MTIQEMKDRMDEIMARLRQWPIPKTEVLLLMAEFATLDGKVKSHTQPE